MRAQMQELKELTEMLEQTSKPGTHIIDTGQLHKAVVLLLAVEIGRRVRELAPLVAASKE